MLKTTNIGGDFFAENSSTVVGLRGVVEDGSDLSYAGYFDCNSTGTDNYGVFAECKGTTSTGFNTAIAGNAFGSSTQNIGGRFTASGVGAVGVQGQGSTSSLTQNTTGGAFKASFPSSGASATYIGVDARVGNPFLPSLLPANCAVAIYGNSDNVNFGMPGYAGFFDGEVFVNGPSSGVGFVLTSDSQLKTNIDSIENANEILGQLNPVSFFYDVNNSYGFNFSNSKQYGLIAQDVETVLPELVTTQHKPAVVDSLGNTISSSIDYKALNYNAFIGILIKANQEQQNTISNLNDRIEALESCINGLNLCNATMVEISENKTSQIQNVELKDVKSLVLEQNVPNPFAEMTTISYELTEGIKRAQLLFYNTDGKLINSMDLSAQSGKGQLNIFANDLSNGVYTYTLVVDGKIIDTKRMIKNK